MRVARKQAAAVYCGVALAALEVVESAQVRGGAVHTSLLTKNKGKKMKKVIAATGTAAKPTPEPAPDDPAPANKTNSAPAPAPPSGRPKGVNQIQWMCIMFAAQVPGVGLSHAASTFKASPGETLKSMSEKLWKGKNWCEMVRKKLKKSGTWEVRAQPSFEAYAPKLKAMMLSFDEQEEEVEPGGSEQASLMSDVCCSKPGANHHHHHADDDNDDDHQPSSLR